MTLASKGVKVINEGMSAAGVLYHFLNPSNRLKKLVAIADLMEYFETPILMEMMDDHGQQKVCEESRILDFSWRLNIEDDLFRMQAALHLSQGLWPSEVGPIKSRFVQVVNERRWPKALARAQSGMRRARVGRNISMPQTRTVPCTASAPGLWSRWRRAGAAATP